MSVLNQKTIKRSIKFEGVGLHSGKKVEMTLFPAQPNTGITFKRSDLKKNNIPKRFEQDLSEANFNEFKDIELKILGEITVASI